MDETYDELRLKDDIEIVKVLCGKNKDKEITDEDL